MRLSTTSGPAIAGLALSATVLAIAPSRAQVVLPPPGYAVLAPPVVPLRGGVPPSGYTYVGQGYCNGLPCTYGGPFVYPTDFNYLTPPYRPQVFFYGPPAYR